MSDTSTRRNRDRLRGAGRQRAPDIETPPISRATFARKGSIAVDGVSLTVNAVSGARFEVNVIPHTRAVTTLGALAVGAPVNLEVDMIARYVERLAAFGTAGE